MEAYSGWGGAQKAFFEKAEGEWGEIRDRLKELLSEDEFASQRHTVLTAFYTPAPVIGAIYDALREAGIGQGDTPAAILEPGCGTGNFMRLAPADLALDFHGVELDPISARIAQALCPEAHITAAGLEECRVSPASFDAAIGNVPYSGDIKIDGMPIHDYFIKKSVEAVRPGGIVAVLTSRYTLDKNSTATRRALAEQAELLGAVRLPAETFRRQAGTEALSDILLLRRRPEPIALSEDELPEWVETSPFEDTVNINRYFNEHPGRAVGAMSIVSGPMGPTLGVSFKGGADALGVRVSDLLRDSVDQGGSVEMAAAQEPAGISVTPIEPTKFEFSVAADGTIWYGTEDAVEPFTPGGGKTGPERARAMLGLRDGARALLALERDPAADDDEVEEAIAELSAEYDSFFERFGRINSKKNLAVFPSKGFTDHSLALNLLSLEKVDSDGEVTGKADILRKRLVTPEAPTPEHVGNPSDALAVTIDARGEVDIDFLADLMETDVQTALERLGDLVVTDPDDASHVMTADEYLSGDVGGKLEHVRELLEAERGRAERQTQQAWNEHLGFAVDAENLTGPTRDALDQLRKTHLWESSLNPTTSRFAVDGPAHVEGLDHGARRIDWTSWPALIPLALEAYDGPRPIGLADCDERRWSDSTGNPLLDQLARGLGNFRSGGAGGALEATPAYAIKYLVCDSGLSDEELGAFLAAGGAEPYNGSDYLEAFQSIAGVEIERPERPMYGGPSARESAIENGMRVARALRAAPAACRGPDRPARHARRRLAALYRPGGRCRQARPHVGQGLPFRRERSIHRAYPDGPHHRPGREGPRGDRAEAARRPALARRRAEGRQGAVPQAGRARRGRTAPRRPRAGAHRGRGAAPARAGPARRGRGRRDRGGRRGGARRRARARARGRGRRRGARGRARGGAAPPGAHLRGFRHTCRGDGRAQRHRERLPERCRRGRALLGGGIRTRGGRRRREAQGRHVSRGAFRVYAIDDTSDRGPVSGPLSHLNRKDTPCSRSKSTPPYSATARTTRSSPARTQAS